MAAAGDRVAILVKKEKIEGILMPQQKEDVILIKLDNGYNAGFNKKEVKKITILKKNKSAKPKQTKLKKNKDLLTISILHTGGTIASKVDYKSGGVTSDFTPEELVSMFPELKDIANIESELISQMWSDDLRFSHFSFIAKKIKEHIDKNVDGIIVGMGTDNLAVAAAALSFIIESSPIPIIFVGAQRSSDRGSSDAGMNLICAAEFIAKTDFAGVAICMHEHADDKTCLILPAAKTYKLHSSRRDAFQPVNADAIARVDYKKRKVTFLQKNYPKKSQLIIKPKMEERVGLLKVHVNMFPEQFTLFKGYKGLVIEGTGLGHTPGEVTNKEAEVNKTIYPAIKEVIDSGCVVMMTTQCIFGSVNMNVYSKGRDLQDLGVISGRDMLANTALVKLSWLLANHPKEVERLMQQNLRGEFSARHEFDKEFVKINKK